MKRLVICTGSSRGIGKSIVTEFNKTFSLETTFVLLARDLEKLNQVKDQILNESNSANSVILIQVDFSQPNQVIDYFNLLKNHIDENKLIDFEELYVVYNHGTLEYGNVSLVAQERLREKFETNLLSIWSLLGAINLYIPTTVISRQFHVNISSGYANKPVALWSGHCCCRVARDMLFKCLALEQSELRVLNYEPGVVYTGNKLKKFP